ncbi:MAG TPA: hypothetical protein DEA55_11945 [Rhodospirillaceae bacterium]|nr:hypothetical protein [Rhodospirillaceae bacterium]
MTKRNGNNGHNGEANLRSCFVLTTRDEAPGVRRTIEGLSKKWDQTVLGEGEMRITSSLVGVPFVAPHDVVMKLEKQGHDVRYNGSCPSPV